MNIWRTKDVDEDTFLRNEEKKDACLTRIVMIGEYSSRISENLKEKFSEVEWQLMKSTRNYYVHVYRGLTGAGFGKPFKKIYLL